MKSETRKDLTISGTLPKLKQEDAKRLAVYLVRGDEVIAQAPVDEYGKFQLPVDAETVTKGRELQLEAVVGPAAMGKRFDPSRNLHRIPLDPTEIEQGKREIALPADKLRIEDSVLKLWWAWCRNYCVSGTVIGPDGCPVPGAQVTASSVVHASGGGYTVTPQGTVVADASGNFTICFDWCTYCWGWPCWPFWWYCWPWWWEWDIIHVLEKLEPRVSRLGNLAAKRSPTISEAFTPQLLQPDSSHLMIGQGFKETRASAERLIPDNARTELIRTKLADPKIRAIFPWWWWCCKNPNLIFTVRQGPNVIVDEDPATDTRWCFPESSSVTLVGDEQTISACGQDPLPAQGFVWTRVGNTLVNTILDGYAQGNPLSNESDGAFTGNLDIFGGFAAASGVAYYQVKAGLYSGNPSRGGTAPAGEGPPISTDLYNYAFMLQPDFTVTVVPVKMGPFTDPAHPGIPNLYATEQHRHLVPVAFLPAFPPGAFIAWAYSGLKVTAPASTLAGGSLGAVRLGVAAFNSALNPVAPLPANTYDHLTLQVDTTPLTVAHINSFSAFTNGGIEVDSTGDSEDCPAFNVGPGGYVVLNVSVRDDNGHLRYYQLVPNFGHGSTGVMTPDVRGYRTPTPFAPPPAPGPYSEPAIAHVAGDPSTGKAFVGGTENILYKPLVNCCYDFRLGVSKRVTNGYSFVGGYTADFWTATLRVTP